MSLRSLIDNLADKKPQAFVAPIPAAERVSVRTIQDGVPYIFNVPSPRPGWWTLIPSGNKVARIDKLAEPHDVIDYLNALPRFYVIALYPTGETTWLVTPYNIADARVRSMPAAAERERGIKLAHSAGEARELARLFAGVRVRVSVIDVNDPEGRFARAGDDERGGFLQALSDNGLGFVRRYSGGPDIDAACGLLASRARGGVAHPPLAPVP